jgi:hypothetical protein
MPPLATATIALVLLTACASLEARSGTPDTPGDGSSEAPLVGESADRQDLQELVGGRGAAGPLGGQLDPARADRQILVTVKLRSSWRPPQAGSSTANYGGEYRVSARTRRVVSRLAEAYSLRKVSGWPIHPLGVHCVVFEVPGSIGTEEIIARLERDERVESAQPMNLFELRSEAYNDPYLGLQHGVTSMQVREAHRWARGLGVRIAVVDTGVDLGHPELRERVLLARDFVDETSGAPSADTHGTAVTGVIVSTADNGIGIIGVAPDARILALKACWQEDGDSSTGRCSSYTLAKALAFAIESRPNILNLSLAGPSDPLLERLMRAVLDRRILVVAAAGDRSSDSFPGGVDGVLAVQSAGESGDEAVVIPTARRRRRLSAPGTDILTTTPAGRFDFLSGRSLATAHVSGVAALLVEKHPRLTAEQLFALLRDTSVSPDPSDRAAAPMVNACNAVSRIAHLPECPRATGGTPGVVAAAAEGVD